MIGTLIVVVGAASSAFLAERWRASAVDTNHSAFRSTATDLSRTLDAKLNANLTLLRSLRAIATMEPGVTDERFTQWYGQLQRGVASSPVVAELIQPVRASHLAAFLRQAEADPVFRKLLAGGSQVTPAGSRPIYCLARALVGPSASSGLYPPLLDYCAPVLPGIGKSPFAALLRSGAGAGSTIVTPIPGFSLVVIGQAVYRRGVPLGTSATRRSAFTGVVGISFDSTALIRSLLGDHHSLTLTLLHENPGASPVLVGRAGLLPRLSAAGYMQRRRLADGWILVTAGTTDHPLAADGQGALALIVGLLITLLVFLVYRVLSTSRRHAWNLVGEKTGELAYQALHDPLTDLPNRALVLDRAEQILARARRLDVSVTALFVDIDGFKQINDRFGHRAGDEVLRQVGARLKTILRDNDTVGRLGGDEFVMLIDSIGINASPELVAERILDVLRQPIELPGQASSPAIVTASIGIATGLPATAEDLLQDADLALYKAKAGGKNGFAMFESAMQADAHKRMHLELDLAAALEGNQFFLVYQPMLDLDSERVVGVEALLRWRHPRSGVIAPDTFIPLAEENGQIVSIGRWVLQRACAQGAAWRRLGHRLTIAVNVSARQLERPEFVDEVRDALRKSGLDAGDLTLEITETVLMREPDSTAALLGELKRLGVRIAVDDFGTGYSSLAYLRQFPVDSLKIDRTFITGLALSSEAHALAHTLIQLGKALGLQTLAEGVEEQSQVRALRLEGCDLAQGFLFARPLAPEALERFLQERTQTATHAPLPALR